MQIPRPLRSPEPRSLAGGPGICIFTRKTQGFIRGSLSEMSYSE